MRYPDNLIIRFRASWFLAGVSIILSLLMLVALLPTGKASANLFSQKPQNDTCNRVAFTFSESPDCPAPSPTNNISSYKYTIQFSSVDGIPHTIDYGLGTFFCVDGLHKGNCADNPVRAGSTVVVPGTGSINASATRSPTQGSSCGMYQFDFTINSVDADTSCIYKSSTGTAGASGYCRTGIDCSANCTTGESSCSSCAAPSDTCGTNNGVQTCTHDQTQICSLVVFSKSCTIDNCLGGNICQNGVCSPPVPPGPKYGISGNIFVDSNGNGSFENPPEKQYSGGVSTITISGGPTSIAPITTSNGVYSTGSVLLPGTYNVSYSGIPPGYFLTTPVQYSIPIGNSDVNNLNFGITNVKSWYQSFCGDVRLDSGITDAIPASPVCGSVSGGYAIQTQSNYCPVSPGVAFSGDNSADFNLGQASVSPYNWQAGGIVNPEVFKDSKPPIRTSYSYMSARVAQFGISPIDLTSICPNLSDCKLGNLSHGLYRANGDVTLTDSNYTFPPGQNYVLLINGNLNLKGALHVQVGSSATFSVAKDINVDSGVGETSTTSLQSDIEGFYSADGSFVVNANSDCTNSKSDSKLNIAGSVIVNAGLQGGSFRNNRDLCAQDSSCPSLTITQRPDLILNAPSFIKQSQSFFQEIAP